MELQEKKIQTEIIWLSEICAYVITTWSFPTHVWVTPSGSEYVVNNVLCPYKVTSTRSAVRMAWMALMTREGDTRGTQKALEGKCEEKRSLGKPTGTKKDNFKLDLQEIRWRHGLVWSGLERANGGLLRIWKNTLGFYNLQRFSWELRYSGLLRSEKW